MTSEQVRALCLQCAEMGRQADNGSPVAISLMEIQGIWEIAYQLAVMNEREASKGAGKTRGDWG